MEKTTNNWDKIKALSTIIASLFIPIVVLIIGNWHSSALKESETKVRYIELALEILKEEPSNENIHIRTWAIDLINKNSDIALDTLAKNELMNEPLFKEVDEFIDEEWIPKFIESFVDLGYAEIKQVIEIGDEGEIKKELINMTKAITNSIEGKRKELKNEIRKGTTTPNNG